MTNKKQKLISGFLASFSTLAVAAGIVGVVLGVKKKDSQHPQFLNGKTVNFSAGEGKIGSNQPKSTTVESGTTFDRVDQPAVTSNNPKKIFGGWKDQEGNLVRGDATVRKDMNLTATYNDADSSEYVTVLFTTDPSEPGPVLQGNQRISVNKGYYFFMVNRPTAKWTVTTSEGVTKQKYFKGWRYSDGTQVGENDKITSNVTLYPIFNEAVTVTWHPNGAHESETPDGYGAIERGQETTTLETGTTFHDFNQPALKYVYTGEKTTGAYFAGWYKDEDCTEEWDESATLSADADAWAKWAKEPEVGDQYGVIAFDNARDTMVDGTTLPTTLTYGWTPTNSIVVKLNDKTWGDTNKPSVVVYNSGVVTSDYRTGAWEIALGTKSGETITYGDYATLSDSYVFPSGTKYYKIRPVLQYAIDSITVYGDDTVQLESTSQYNVIIEGGSTSAQKVTWSLLTEDGKAFPDGIAKISDSGLVTIASPSRSLWETYGYNCFVVKAQSQLDASKSNTLKVSLSMPYTDNMYVWIHTESSESDNPKWYYADLDAFCDSSATTVIAKSLADDSQHVFDKTVDFTDTITFGTDIYAIPDNFLAGWTNFKGSVDLKNSSIMLIGNEFMAGCTNFNNSLYLSNLTSIGANFLKGCTSYDTAITFNSSAPLTWIGEGFMNGCTKFNSTITLPTITSFEIENGFLYNCTSYNQPLILPSIITYIGDFFMCECKAFTSTITTSVEMSNFVVSDSSLSSVDSTAAIYQTGFQVAGTQGDNFRLYYKTITGDHNRTVLDKPWIGEVTDAQFKAGKEKLAAAYNLTAQYGIANTYKFNANSSSNASDWSGVQKISNNVTTYIVKDSDLNNAEIEYEEDGHFYKSLPIGDSTSPNYIISQIHSCATIDSTVTTGTWTLNETNKWYEYTYDTTVSSSTYNNRVILMFSQSTLDIEYVAIDKKLSTETNWTNQFAINITRINTTDTFTLPTSFTHKNTTTWNSETKRYEGAETTTIGANHNTGFVFTLTTAEYATMPDIVTAWVYTTDASQGLEGSYDTTKGACVNVYASNGKAKTISTTLNSSNVLEIICEGGFADGDKIVVTFTGEFTEKVNFGAQKLDYLNFLTCSWTEINTACTAVEEGTMTTDEFCKLFRKGTTAITSMDQFIGLDRTITLNGYSHIVRVIDYQHDLLTTQPTGKTGVKATLTFELFNILTCTSYGTPTHQTSAWHSSASNYDYINSQLRANLTGQGSGTKSWGSTALTLLQNGNPTLYPCIKSVEKSVKTTSSYTVSTYSDTLFALTGAEMAQGTGEGSVYRYWSSHNSDASRIKYTTNGYARIYWLASPNTGSGCSGYSWCVSNNGKIMKYVSSTGGYGVTFGFCI